MVSPCHPPALLDRYWPGRQKTEMPKSTALSGALSSAVANMNCRGRGGDRGKSDWSDGGTASQPSVRVLAGSSVRHPAWHVGTGHDRHRPGMLQPMPKAHTQPSAAAARLTFWGLMSRIMMFLEWHCRSFGTGRPVFAHLRQPSCPGCQAATTRAAPAAAGAALLQHQHASTLLQAS